MSLAQFAWRVSQETALLKWIASSRTTEEWSSVSIERGALFAMISGMKLMPVWSAINWVTPDMVSSVMVAHFSIVVQSVTHRDKLLLLPRELLLEDLFT